MPPDCRRGASREGAASRIPLVYIIILNWNGWHDTVACVESCRKLTWRNYRILVVDNASSDGSEEILRKRLADVEIIQTGANLGFAGGNNVGIRHALDSGGDYVWLLNNDAEAAPEALTALVEEMEREPSAGIAGSKIYFHDDPRRIWFAGGSWEKGRLRLRHRGANRLDEGQYDEGGEIGSVSGCSMLVRSAAIREIGLMEESYFLYWEDTEWCARGREKGYRVLFVPASHIWHKVSASAGQGSFSQHYYSTRNGFRFLWEHDSLLLPRFALYNILFGIKSLVMGSAQPLRGFVSGLIGFIQGKSGERRPNSGQ
jgi:GT2 family glycosyltransferase